MKHPKKEKAGTSKKAAGSEKGSSPKQVKKQPVNKQDEDMIDTNESDLTPDDYEALGPPDLSMDGGDDEELAQRSHPVDFSGDDLDVPGAELDDAQEKLGSEDEENNSYSLSNNS